MWEPVSKNELKEGKKIVIRKKIEKWKNQTNGGKKGRKIEGQWGRRSKGGRLPVEYNLRNTNYAFYVVLFDNHFRWYGHMLNSQVFLGEVGDWGSECWNYCLSNMGGGKS